MSSFAPNEIIIDDTNYRDHLPENMPVLEGQPRFSTGYIERDYSKVPYGSIRGVAPFNIPVIPRNEWSSRIKDMEQSQSRLSDIRMIGDNGKPIESLDQNGEGYCWAYSVCGGIIIVRARDGQPYERLSGHSVACKIKNFRDQGGWSPAAAEFAAENGYVPTRLWTEKSMSRSHDTQENWAEAKRFRITDGFWDLVNPAYDRKLTFDQFMTCLLLRIPCTMDLNWWGHSVLGLDPLEFDTSLPLSDINRWGAKFWNSWRDSYGVLGTGNLRGSKAVPNGGVAIKSSFQTAA